MINQIVLVGRLTKDLELKYTYNNVANLRFTVAVNRQFANQQGERQADFINCVAWRQTAENMAKFLRKGSLIGVTGRIETGSYQNQQGQTVYTTDVIADSVQFLEPRDKNQNSQQQSNPFPANNSGMGTNPFPSNTGNSAPEPTFNSTIDINDDDLPF